MTRMEKLSRERSLAIYRRAMELAQASNARLSNLIAEVPRLVDELRTCDRPTMTTWVWDGLREEAEYLRGLLDDGTLDEPPAILRVCRLTPEEELNAIGACAMQAQLARRVLALVADVAITHPHLCGEEDFRRLGT